MLGLGDHGDDDIGFGCQLHGILAGHRSLGSQQLHLCGDEIEAVDCVVMLLDNVFAHGLAHDAQTNKTDLHSLFSFSSPQFPLSRTYSVTVLSHALMKVSMP